MVAEIAVAEEEVWMPHGDVSLDPDAWIASRMTAAEAEAFTERGWLEIDDALPPAVLEEMRAAVEAVREQKLEEGRDADEVIRQCAFSAANSMQEGDAVTNLLAANRALPKAVDILGANVNVNYCRVEWA